MKRERDEKAVVCMKIVHNYLLLYYVSEEEEGRVVVISHRERERGKFSLKS